MRIRLHFFLLLLYSLFSLWISSAKLDYTNTTVEVLQCRRTLLRKNQSRGIRDGSLEYLTTLLNSRTKLFTTWHDNLNNPFHHANEDDYVRFIRALTPWILSPPAYPSHPVYPLTLPPLPPLHCGQPRYAHVLTGQPLAQPRIIVDFIPFGYDIDKLELRLYEYYDLVDAFVVYESPKTHGGTDKILYFKQLLIQKDPRFQPFLSKVIHLSVTSGVLEPLAKLVKTALQEGDRFKLKSHSWDLEVGIHILTVFIFLLCFHSVNKSCVSIFNDPCRYVVVSIPNISHTLSILPSPSYNLFWVLAAGFHVMQRAMRLEMLRQFNTHQGDVKLDALRKLMNAGGGSAQSALGIQNDAGTPRYSFIYLLPRCSLSYISYDPSFHTSYYHNKFQ